MLLDKSVFLVILNKKKKEIVSLIFRMISVCPYVKRC